ncbi:MAG: CapA family protein [Gemmatimonadetes bacterium]|nr:CapA family protein [Gemmatimonadota bacterium]
MNAIRATRVAAEASPGLTGLVAWFVLAFSHAASPPLVPAQGGPADSAAAPRPPRITMVAVGDINLARRLGERMHAANDYSLPFRSIAPVLADADIAFGNLEAALCPRPPYPLTGFSLRARPRAVEALVGAGLDVVSVANNHFGDCGAEGIRFGVERLRARGVRTAGAGLDFDEAHAAAIIERQGVRFAFLAYSYAARGDVPRTHGAVIAGLDTAQLRRDVAAARAAADVVLVSVHDGIEYARQPTAATQRFARAAIDAGALVVLGHHPHVPQPVESYNDGWIFYSLGNFVFEQFDPGTRTGLMARLTFLGAKLEKAEAVPIVIETFARPRLAASEDGSR